MRRYIAEAYSGQSITVKSLGTDTVQINEVEVFGTEIVCPFTSFSDNDGNFEIELSDPAGLAPKKRALPPLHTKRTSLILLTRNSSS